MLSTNLLGAHTSAPPADELALPCDVRRVPLADSLRALHASRAWRAHASLLIRAEPADAWCEGCWRFYVYDGRTAGGAAQIVFAVRLEGRPPEVKVAVVAAGRDVVMSGQANGAGSPAPRRTTSGSPLE